MLLFFSNLVVSDHYGYIYYICANIVIYFDICKDFFKNLICE
jgi:hypothetical protein